MNPQNDIPFHRLGRTGYMVHPLGLGGHAYPIGNDAESFRTPDERAELVAALVKGGVNYFDTTWMNEVESLHDSFRRAGIKDGAVVSLQYVDGMSDPDWKNKLKREIESRLEVMGWPLAPLFIMGTGNGEVTFEAMVESFRAMDDLKREGLIGSIGASCHRTEHFPLLERVISETDLPDYLMLKFNWKERSAKNLLDTAKEHDVGTVVMKVFCWDCGPGHWDKRISVFEADGSPPENEATLNPAQRSLIWSLAASGASTSAVSMNTLDEASLNLDAVAEAVRSGWSVDDTGFETYATRLWREDSLREIALNAGSKTIRDRAEGIIRKSGF